MPLINLSYPETVKELNLGSSIVGTNSKKLGGYVRLSEFVELTSFICKDNDIQYDDIDIEDNKIKHFIVPNNKIEKIPRLDKYPELEILDFKNNNVSFNAPSKFWVSYFKSPVNSLVYANLAENGFSGAVPTVTALPDLEGFDLSANNFTVYEDNTANGGYNENLLYFNLQGNFITDINQINSILINLSSGGGFNGYVNLSGGTMAIPYGIGIVAKNVLEERGWTVLLNHPLSALWNFDTPSSGDELTVLVAPSAEINWGDGNTETLANNTETTHRYTTGFIPSSFRFTSPLDVTYFEARKDINPTDAAFGGVINVAALPGLVFLSINSHLITDILGVDQAANLNRIDILSNSLSGNIKQYMPPNIEIFQIQHNAINESISGNSLEEYTSLDVIATSNNTSMGGSFPTFNTNIQVIDFGACGMSGNLPSLSSYTNLSRLWLYINSFSISPCFDVPASLTNFDLGNNSLSAVEVDRVLAAFDNAGATNGTLKLGGNNAAPTNGYRNGNYVSLSATKGWNVDINDSGSGSWIQLGQDLVIDPGKELFFDVESHSVSMNAVGDRVAIGGRRYGENFNEHAYIYELSGSDWIQLGSPIEGESFKESSYTVSMNASGDRVAIGTKQTKGLLEDDLAGHTRIYEFNGSDWIQLGSDIDGEDTGGRSGYSVSMNADGDRVAIGAVYGIPIIINLNNTLNNKYVGHTRIYELSGSDWTQLGSDIDGEAAGDESGYSVSMNAAGDRVAIGAINNDGDTSIAFGDRNSGHTRIYELSGSDWTQLGSDIDGDNGGDRSGYSVSMNAVGDRVAIGAIGDDGTTSVYSDGHSNDGQVRIYELSGSDWTQLGSDIYGEAAGDESGYSVSMNADGDCVAIGAVYNDGNGRDSGHTRIYELSGSDWIQLGLDIDGEAVDSRSGYNVSMNAAGDRVAIASKDMSAPRIGTDSVDEYPGKVQIYTKGRTLACGTDGYFSHSGSGIFRYSILLGSEIGGTSTLEYNARYVPDRFVVTHGGVDVIDTGFVGNGINNPSYREDLDSIYGKNGWVDGGRGPGEASFVKTSPDSYATVTVYAPLPGTWFEFNLGCPQIASADCTQ